MRTVSELVGESLREIGVLLLVFIPFDATFFQGSLKPATVVGLVILAIAGFVLVVVGILLEKGTD